MSCALSSLNQRVPPSVLASEKDVPSLMRSKPVGPNAEPKVNWSLNSDVSLSVQPLTPTSRNETRQGIRDLTKVIGALLGVCALGSLIHAAHLAGFLTR